MKKIILITTMLFATTLSFATTIKIIVPFAVGGIADQSARQVAVMLSQTTPYNYVVENHVGASGQIAARHVIAQKGPDTVLLVHSASVILHGISSTSTYNVNDFVPVSTIGSIQWFLITHKDSHVNSLDLLLTTDDPVFFGSSGEGTTNHIAGEILKKSTKRNMIHVPYRGESAALVDLMGNRISLLFAGVGVVKGNETVRVLAVSGPKRHPDYPNVPTFSEIGIKGFEKNLNWLVILANPGADPKTVSQIQTAIDKLFSDPKQTQLLTNLGIDIEKNPLNTKEFLNDETSKLRAFIK